MGKKTNSRFYLKYKEKADMNQYWYSPATIEFLANQALGIEKVCFMSTPSIFFSVPESEIKQGWFVFDVAYFLLSLIKNSDKRTPTSSNMTSNIRKPSQNSSRTVLIW